MRQANELGGHVRKGEESTIVVFWKVEDAKQSTKDLDHEETNEKTRRRFLLRYYRVWNLEQCDLPQAVLDKLPKIETHEHDPIEAAERIIAGMPNPPEIQHAGSKAFYSPITDRITLPPRELFASVEEFYATALHETDSFYGKWEKACARRDLRSGPLRFRRLLERRIMRGNGSRLPLRRSRNLNRGNRQPGGIRGRLAQKTSR